MAFDPTSAVLDDDVAPAPSTFDPSTAIMDEDADQGVLGTLWEGVKSTGRALGATANTYTGDAEPVIDKAARQQEAPKDYRLEGFHEGFRKNVEAAGEDPGVLDSIGAVGKAVKDNPAGAGLAVVEQLPNSVPTLAGGYAGLKAGAALGGMVGGPVGAGVGGIVGGLAGMFLGNTAIETGHKAMAAADDGEYTPEEMAQVKREGAVKGGVITAVDAATLGIGGKVAGAMQRTTATALETATRKALVDRGVDVTDEAAVLAARQSPEISAAVRAAQDSAVKATDTLRRRAAEAGTLMSMETVGEGLGEYLGELAATGEGDIPDAVLESMLSIGQSAAETAWNMGRKREQSGLWGAAEPGAEPGGDSGAPAPDMVQPLASDANPSPAPVPRPDPANGPLSAAASLLPAASSAGQPTAEQNAPEAGVPADQVAPPVDAAPETLTGPDQRGGQPVAEAMPTGEPGGQAVEAGPAAEPTEPPATPSQRAILRRRGVGDEQLATMTRQQAGELLRQQNGTGPENQARPPAAPQQLSLEARQDTEASLREELTYLERQARASGGWTAALTRERARIRTALEPFEQATQQPAETANAFEDSGAAGQAAPGAQTTTQGQLAGAPASQSAPASAAPAAPVEEAGQATVPTREVSAPLQQQGAEPSIEGNSIGDGWAEFTPESGTLRIPRADMPQIRAEHRGAMVNFLNARGVQHQEETVPAADLKPTQAEFSREKVKQAAEFTGGNRSILVSRAGHVLDGHHQWLAAREKGEEVKIIRLDAPIRELVQAAHEFPSSSTESATESASAPALARTAQPVVPAGPAPSEKAPAIKQKKPRGVLAKKAEAEAKARGEYFAPGNIVAGYGGHDRVVAYTPPDAEGNWSVTVRAVQKQGDAWVDAPDQRERTHMTAPTSRELRMGPVERVIAEQQPAGQRPVSPEIATTQAGQAVEASAGVGPAYQRNSAAKIEDAGEKLGGARKDELRGVRERLESMDDAAIATSKLSELWPKSEIDRIEDPFHAAAYQTVRGHIPAKPRAEYRVRSWVSKVKAARELIAELSDMGSDASLAKLREFSPGLRLVADKIELLIGLNRSQWDRIGSVSINHGRYNQDGEMVPGSWVSVEIDKRINSFYGHDSIASALPGLKELMEGKAAPEKKMKFAIFSDRRTDDVFIAQDSDKERRPLKHFADLKAARAYLADHHDELVTAWEAVKNRDNVTRADMRRATNAQRAGRDYRGGKDITPEQFLDAFGFRGVEFGNWVKQGAGGRERQGMINDAYDAFMDLADIVGVPPKALSLEGRLGIGFGSRGRGKASAHFEPGGVVINLTKTKGAGSLAHEWFHALDNYFAGKRGAAETGTIREGAYITYRPEPMLINKRYPAQRITRAKLDMYQANHPGAALYAEDNWMPDPSHPQGVRPQVERAFAELVETLDRSPMAQRAAVLDKGTVDGYWSRIIERSARAFETYVIAKLADRGARNDYLANVATLEEFSRNRDRYPYLAPDEQGPVNEAFDKLFSAIETRTESDGSVALYSRGSYRQGQVAQGSKAVPLRLQLQRLIGGWQNAPKVKVVQSVANLPDAQRRQVERDGAFDVEGMFADGQVYLVADNLRDVKHAAFVLQHEVLGHAGLQGAYGRRLEPLLMSLYNEHAALRAQADALVQRYGYTPAVAMEEVLADMAAEGTLREQAFWQRLVAAMRNALRSIGMRVVWSDGDIQALLANARRYIVNGRRRPGARAAFSRGGRSGRGVELTDAQGRLLAPNGKPSRLNQKQWHQARGENFKRWFGNWQAVATQERLDAMKPLRLKMPEAWQGMSEKEKLAAVEAALKGMVRDGEVLHHDELGDVKVGSRGVKKATSSAADPAKKLVLSRLRETFEHSIYAASEASTKGAPVQATFHKTLAPIEVDHVPLVAVFTVREDANGAFFYNAVTVTRKGEAPAASPRDMTQEGQRSAAAFTGASASAASPRELTLSDQRSTSAITEVASFVRQPLARVNPADVSKVIDRNGEPLVLYHGTGEQFTVFEQGRAGRSTGHATAPLGIFLTDDGSLAQAYARKAADGMPGLANVMPLFASIKNPYRMSVAESQRLDTAELAIAMRQRLEREGYDGIQLGDTGTWVAFYNNQVKSATNNTGAFDVVDPDIRYRRAGQQGFIGRQAPFELTARNAKRHLQGRLADLKPAMLAALPLMYLRDFAPRSMTALGDYIDAKRAMDADRNELHTRYDAISQRWLKLRWSDRKAEQRLADLMHAATLAGVDPSKPAKEDYTPEQKREYNRLSLMYRSLPEGHRAMFGEVRDAYRGQVEGLEQVIEENIRKSGDYAIKRAKRDRDADIQQARDELAGAELDEAIEEADKRYQRRVAAARAGNSSKLLLLRTKFESMRVDEPYFPLKRFGEYFVAMRDGTKLVSFSMFERAADMEAAAEDLRRAYPGLDVSVGRQSNKQELAGAVDPGFVSDLQELVARLPNGEEVSEQMWQMYLETLPDYSMRKGFIHRKKTPGFARDAMRAFASSMFHSSYQIARLKYSLEMNELVEQIEEQAKASADPVDAMTIANEMRKRHEWVMAPKGGKIAQHITSAAFVYQLGITPAAALVNMTQTWMMGIPVLGTRFGSEAKATAALTKASKDFVQGRGHLERRLEGQEAEAFAEFMRMGLIDKTQAHDLAGVGETGVEYNPLRHKVMGYISWAFHNAERYNREVTAMAAYRLGRESGLEHAAAIKEAAELTWTTHFDYSSGNRARFMQSDTAKVLLVFRQHSVNMLSRLVIDLKDAMKGETAQVKNAAKRRLAGMFAMFGLFAGVMGIPGATAVLALLDLFDDDDDPWSAEDKMKRTLVEALGPDVAAAVLDGVPGTLMDLSLTERIGMGSLWFFSSNRELEGKDAYLYWMEQVLGAAPAMVANAFTGMSMIGEGHVFRGIETMMPKAIKDAMRSGRYATEGVQTMSGDSLVDEVSTWNVIAQAMGFLPAHIAERYDTNSALRSAEQRIKTERRSILNRYAMAVRQGDGDSRQALLARIRDFNRRYPQVAITGQTINLSLKARAQRDTRTVGGLALDRRLEFLREGM